MVNNMARKKELPWTKHAHPTIGEYKPPSGVDVSQISPEEKAALWSKLPDEAKRDITELVKLRDAFDGTLHIDVQ